VTPHEPERHAVVWHAVSSFGHCDASVHATQVPWPSQNMLPPAPQTVLIVVFEIPQVPFTQVRVWQVVSWPGHSLAVLQPTQAPWPSQNMLPLAPQVVFAAASSIPHAPEAHVLV
jgi:hypothetical protein